MNTENHLTYQILKGEPEDKQISAYFNQFLEQFDYTQACWFLFCSPYLEIKENLDSRLPFLNQDAIYGPRGIILEHKHMFSQRCYGQSWQSDTSDTIIKSLGEPNEHETIVNVLDSRCIIVHSSLIERYHLRFDEQLGSELIGEDLCIQAKERFDIPSKVFQLDCIQHTNENISLDYNKHVQYLLKKHQSAQHSYCVFHSELIIGKALQLANKTILGKLKSLVKNSLLKISGSSKQLVDKPILVHLHIFYKSLWTLMAQQIKNIHPHPFDLFVTLVEDDESLKARILAEFPQAHIILTENRGYDVRPFLSILHQVNLEDYSYVVKLHTKGDTDIISINSELALSGTSWRNKSLNFINSPQRFNQCIQTMQRKKNIGMHVDRFLILRCGLPEDFSSTPPHLRPVDLNANLKLKAFVEEHHLQNIYAYFAAGTMFIAKAPLLNKLKLVEIGDSDLFESHFVKEGQYAHMIERLIGYCIYLENHIIDDILQEKIKPRILATKPYSASSKEYELIKNSRYFDSEWYIQNNRDVRELKCDPVEHYLNHGSKEKRFPGPLFNPDYYFSKCMGPEQAHVSPLLHYEQNKEQVHKQSDVSPLGVNLCFILLIEDAAEDIHHNIKEILNFDYPCCEILIINNGAGKAITDELIQQYRPLLDKQKMQIISYDAPQDEDDAFGSAQRLCICDWYTMLKNKQDLTPKQIMNNLRQEAPKVLEEIFKLCE